MEGILGSRSLACLNISHSSAVCVLVVSDRVWQSATATYFIYLSLTVADDYCLLLTFYP